MQTGRTPRETAEQAQLRLANRLWQTARDAAEDRSRGPNRHARRSVRHGAPEKSADAFRADVAADYREHIAEVEAHAGRFEASPR